MIASFMAGIRWTLTQTVTQKHELGLSNPLDMIFHIQPAMIVFLLPLALFVEGKSLMNSDKFFQSTDMDELANNMFAILIGAALAFVLEASEYLVVTFTSSLTFSISGILKEVFQVYLAVELNNNKLTTVNTVGLVIILIGSILSIIFYLSYNIFDFSAKTQPF
jgi:solute carrier family 35 protein C2